MFTCPPHLLHALLCIVQKPFPIKSWLILALSPALPELTNPCTTCSPRGTKQTACHSASVNETPVSTRSRWWPRRHVCSSQERKYFIDSIYEALANGLNSDDGMGFMARGPSPMSVFFIYFVVGGRVRLMKPGSSMKKGRSRLHCIMYARGISAAGATVCRFRYVSPGRRSGVPGTGFFVLSLPIPFSYSIFLSLAASSFVTFSQNFAALLLHSLGSISPCSLRGLFHRAFGLCSFLSRYVSSSINVWLENATHST